MGIIYGKGKKRILDLTPNSREKKIIIKNRKLRARKSKKLINSSS